MLLYIQIHKPEIGFKLLDWILDNLFKQIYILIVLEAGPILKKLRRIIQINIIILLSD